MLSRLEKTVITLESDEVQQLKEIIIDQDKEKALAFLIEVIDQKVQFAWSNLYQHEELGKGKPHQAT